MRNQRGRQRVARPSHRVSVRSGATPLVARDRELAALVDAAKWSPALVLVSGAAGVGKSRLVGGLVDEIAGRHWVAVRPCGPPRGSFPFGVVIELLSGYRGSLVGAGPAAGALRGLLPELADRLPPEPPSADPRVTRRRLMDGFREVLRALGRATLVVEDAQWADKFSLHLLRLVVADPPPGLTLVVTYRPDESSVDGPLGRQAATLVALEPLDVAGVGELASAVMGGQVSPSVAEVLWRQSAGLPSIVEDVVGSLHGRTDLADADMATAEKLLTSVPVPMAVREEVLGRMGILPGPARSLLGAAAVLDGPADVDLLSAVAGIAADQVPDLARRTGLVLGDNGYDYLHPLARRAAHETLSGPERAVLHTRAMRALAESAQPLRLARHAALSGSLRDWLRYGERAADLAMEAGEDATAVTLLSALITEPEIAPTDVARLVTMLCRYGMNGTRHEELITLFERLFADTRLTDEVRAEVAIGLGMLLIRAPGDLPRSETRMRSAAGTLGTDEPWSLRGIAVLGMPYLGTKSIEECRRWQGLIAARVREMPPGAPRTALLASTLQSRLTMGDPDTEDMIALLPDRIDPHDREHIRQLARAQCNLADACAWMGHYDRARDLLAAGLRHADAAAALYVHAVGSSTGVRLDWLAGAWDGLDQRAEAIIDANPGAFPVVSEMRLIQGWLALAQGDWERAARCFLATRMSEPETAMAPIAISATAGMITLSLTRGDSTAARAHADAGTELLRRQGVWAWAGDLLPVAVEAYISHGRVDAARHLVDDAVAGQAGIDAPFVDAALAAARAHLAQATGPRATARRLFTAAAKQHERLGLPYHAACLTEHAATRSTADTFRRLAEVYESLGASMAAARCRHQYRTMSGTAIPSHRGRKGYGEALSPRETDIARLLMSGQTNQEIGRTLFLSRRTVEDHVANVLRKLGADSRNTLKGGRGMPPPAPGSAVRR